MEELKKIWKMYQEKMEEAQGKHVTDIDGILNGDEGAPLGDWTEEEVKTYEYALNRSTVIYNAMKIMEEEQKIKR